ncbi:MAG TPA: hypothetical protein VH590_07485 [Ktedonobacterales bacterium]|jgi:hypothetical protein
MGYKVLIHIINDDPFEAEMEDLPNHLSTSISFTNPRKRDGKNVAWMTQGARSFIFPMTRISFIEVMVSDQDINEMITFYKNR